MNSFLSFLIRMAVSVPSVVVIWLVSFFAINNPFGLSTVLSLAGGAAAYWLTGFYTKSRFLKKNQLTRKEYHYIKKNLEDAKQKISRIHKTLFSIRHIPSLKERVELLRIVRRIYSLTKKEPRRFFLAERFYFSHLDSILELTEKYAFLSSQPKKNRELELSLRDTQDTLSDLSKLVEDDLYRMLRNDLEDLSFEIDVAKYSIKNVRDVMNERSDKEKPSAPRKAEKTPVAVNTKAAPDQIESEGEETGPRYFINTKIAEKETVKVPLEETRSSRYKDKNRRFPE